MCGVCIERETHKRVPEQPRRSSSTVQTHCPDTLTCPTSHALWCGICASSLASRIPYPTCPHDACTLLSWVNDAQTQHPCTRLPRNPVHSHPAWKRAGGVILYRGTRPASWVRHSASQPCHSSNMNCAHEWL